MDAVPRNWLIKNPPSTIAPVLITDFERARTQDSFSARDWHRACSDELESVFQRLGLMT